MKNSKKLLNILITATLAATLTQFTSKLDAKIPEYKGLYTLFTKETDQTPATDTIGIGQSLLYSNWIENILTYAPAENPMKKVIEILWYKRTIDIEGNFIDTFNFGPYALNPINSLEAKDIVKIIKYIREFKKHDNPENRPKLSIKNSGSNKEQLNKLFTALEELKLSDNFVPEITEC